MEYITLNNGIKMPKAGFGVFQIKDKNLSSITFLNSLCWVNGLNSTWLTTGVIFIPFLNLFHKLTVILEIPIDLIFILDAIDAGYRLIDTAQSYGNEEAVGEAVTKVSFVNIPFFPSANGAQASNWTPYLLLYSKALSCWWNGLTSTWLIAGFTSTSNAKSTNLNLNTNTSSFFSHYDPATVEMICGLKR